MGSRGRTPPCNFAARDQWNADQGREEHCRDRELDGESGEELVGDGPAAQILTPSRVPDRLQVAPVLLVERAVELQLVTDLRDRLGRSRSPECLRRRSPAGSDPAEDENRAEESG